MASRLIDVKCDGCDNTHSVLMVKNQVNIPDGWRRIFVSRPSNDGSGAMRDRQILACSALCAMQSIEKSFNRATA